MNRPFPGMDPYLESPAYWRDFHARFITYWCDWLADILPDHYEVSIDERVTLLEEGDRADMLPDVSISQTHPLPVQSRSGETIALEREPIPMRVALLDEAAERFLRIMHRPDATLVTVLELLSPTNKEGTGRRDYLHKRNEQLRDSVHLVEIDLLLGGKRLPMEGILPPGDYYAIVSRGDRRPDSEVYAWGLKEPLPRIRVPLKFPDPDAILDLPALLDQAYHRGRYARSLPYSKPPTAPLSPDNAQWVKDRLAAWTPA